MVEYHIVVHPRVTWGGRIYGIQPWGIYPKTGRVGSDWYRSKVAAFFAHLGSATRILVKSWGIFTKCKPPNKGYCHFPPNLPAAWMNSVSMCLLASILARHAILPVMMLRGSWEFFWIPRDWCASEHATAAVKPYSSTLQFLVVCVKKQNFVPTFC